MPETFLGLRIDVDTYRGTKIGVPELLKTLSKQGVIGSFFFSIGPDNMGRHILKILKSGFFKKMMRSNAPGLYGWDIIFKGTLWPGPVIGEKCSRIIRSAAMDGHEIGLHAWDHHQWQTRILTMDRECIFKILAKGYESLGTIIGDAPTCSAAPGWICNSDILEIKERFSFTHNSDCRGSSIFFPKVNRHVLAQPQIPTTLPTYDEIIGGHGLTHANYNEYLISLIKPGQLNVLTIHAEAEGILCSDLFDNFLKRVLDKKICILPLGDLIEAFPSNPVCEIENKKIKGRHGKVCTQVWGQKE